MTSIENNNPIKGKKRKKKRNFGYFYLFVFVFFAVLVGLSYILKSYSPDIDVAIGNNEALTLSESEMDVEIKSIDERLKWIQMEDEMPTVAKRNTDENNDENKKNIENDEEKKIMKPPIPIVEDIQLQKTDFRSISPAMPVIPLPEKPNVITKVYLGSYSSLEEAMAIQSKVSTDEPSIEPFIKAIKDTYIVQLGSFSDKDKANALIEKLKEKGYTPKIISSYN